MLTGLGLTGLGLMGLGLMGLGGRLRQLREATGMVPADARWAIRGSHSKINRMETGRSGFERRDVSDLLTLYGGHDETGRNGLMMLVEKANMTS